MRYKSVAAVAGVFTLPFTLNSYADFSCPPNGQAWYAERDETHYVIYGDRGVDYGSSVSIEGWQKNSLAWKSAGEITCSNGASICYLIVENERDEADSEKTNIVVETIDEDGNGIPEWIVLASFGQTMWPVWGLHADWSEGVEAVPIYPPNVYKLSGCPRPKVTSNDASEDKTPAWAFKEGRVHAIGDESRSLVLGGTFSRENLERFLGDSTARIVETEGEDCTYCYYITINEGSELFIDSSDKNTINHIRAYGSKFTDDYSIINDRYMISGDIFSCHVNEMDGYEACYKGEDGNISYIVNRQNCTDQDRTDFNDSKDYRSIGCEIIDGYEIGLKY